MSFWAILIGVLFLVVCLFLIVVVLLQKGKGGGLGAAFGGMGSSAFGTRTGDVFTWVTIVLTGLFLLLATGASLVFHPTEGVVALPTFQPEPGEYSEPVAVSIQCDTKGATIRFTLDGTDPGENSAVWNNRDIRIEPPGEIRARAERGKWKASPVAVGVYRKARPTTAAAPPALPGAAATAPATAPAGG